MRSSRRSSPSFARLGAGAAAISLVLATTLGGCTAAQPAPAATPVVAGAWVRPPAAAGLPAAGYMTISNAGGQIDALTGIASSVASAVELHETTTAAGMTGMHPISRLEIPPGGSVKLEPGGYHLMLMGVGTLTVGSTVELVLTFEKAGKVTIKAEVKNA